MSASSLSTQRQIPPANFHVPVLGQLTAAQLPLGDGLEPGPLGVVPSSTVRRWVVQGAGSWQSVLLTEFRTPVKSPIRPFPEQDSVPRG
jgi:hypothetical protein